MNIFYCPIVSLNLDWELESKIKQLLITDKVKIITSINLPSLSLLSNDLSPNTLVQYKIQVHYWLCLKNDFSEVEEIVNIFQLALWIIKPTELQINFISNFEKDKLKYEFRNLLSRFVPIHNHFDFEYNNIDLTNLKIFFPIMMDLYGKKRFKNSIVFNYHGCITSSWEAAYILFSTTFESLLTHKNKWGTTKKIAWAYAVLIETKNEKRQIAYKNFRNIYEIRSEILHGKSFKDKFGKGEINLERLAKCRDMLRELWKIILDSEEIIENLSGDDIVRRDYFIKVANGWMPEEENGKKS